LYPPPEILIQIRQLVISATAFNCGSLKGSKHPLHAPGGFAGNCGNTVSQQEEAGQASSPITHQNANPTIGVQAPSPPEPEPQTCEECFTAFLTADEIISFEEALSDLTGGTVTSVAEACLVLELAPPESQQEGLLQIAGLLQQIGIDSSIIAEIIDCLERVLGS
jgi:hypothetical protein